MYRKQKDIKHEIKEQIANTKKQEQKQTTNSVTKNKGAKNTRTEDTDQRARPRTKENIKFKIKNKINNTRKHQTHRKNKNNIKPSSKKSITNNNI